MPRWLPLMIATPFVKDGAVHGLRAVLCYEGTGHDGPEVARAGIAENVRIGRGIGWG